MALLPGLIATRRLRLRMPTVADAEAIFAAYAQDPEVCRYLLWPPHGSVAVTRDFIAECLAGWASGTTLPYVIEAGDTGDVLGMLEARVEPPRIDIGYVLARARWGRGLMPEAVDALTAACLARPEIDRVQGLCDVENHASARVLEKCGFVLEARLERYGVHPNISPEPRDVLRYARSR